MRWQLQFLTQIAINMKQKIIDKLSKLNPVVVNIDNFSEQHKGHSGWDESGETHFKILLISNEFIGLSRIERHRLIYNALGEELKTKIHALKIKALTVEEYNN